MANRAGITAIWGDPYSSVGLAASGDAGAVPTGGLETAVTPDEVTRTKPYSPESPLFWAFATLAVAFGLVGLSTSARVGPFRASASAGRTGDKDT